MFGNNYGAPVIEMILALASTTAGVGTKDMNGNYGSSNSLEVLVGLSRTGKTQQLAYFRQCLDLVMEAAAAVPDETLRQLEATGSGSIINMKETMNRLIILESELLSLSFCLSILFGQILMVSINMIC